MKLLNVVLCAKFEKLTKPFLTCSWKCFNGGMRVLSELSEVHLTSKSLKNKCVSARLKIISSILRPNVTAIGGSWYETKITSSWLKSYAFTILQSCEFFQSQKCQFFYTFYFIQIHTPVPNPHLYIWYVPLIIADADRQVALVLSHQHSSCLVGRYVFWGGWQSSCVCCRK